MIKVYLQFLISLAFFAFLSPSQVVKAQNIEPTPLYECWKLESDAITKIASDNVSKIFYSSSDGIIESVNLNDGKPIWKSELGGELISEILYDEEKIYVVTKNSGQEEIKEKDIVEKVIKDRAKQNITIRAISVLTGLPIWQKNIEINNLSDTSNSVNLFEIDNKIYLLNTFGEILILDKIKGNIEKQIDLEINISANPIISSKNIYLGTDKKSFESFSVETNELTKQFELKESAKVIAIGNNDKDEIFVGDNLGTVYAYNLNKKKSLWKTRTGAEITNITENDNKLLVSSNDNFIYSISASTGNIIWKKKMAGRNQTVLFKNVADDEKDLLFTTTINTDVFTVTNVGKGNTVNQIYLQNNGFFVGRPLLLADYVILPTNSGFSAYSLSKCKVSEQPIPRY